MVRGWIVAASLAGLCVPQSVEAQQVASSLMDRLGMGGGQQQQQPAQLTPQQRQRLQQQRLHQQRLQQQQRAQQQQFYVDEQVELAADQSFTSSRAARNNSSNSAKSQGSSFFSRFKLPSLTPKQQSQQQRTAASQDRSGPPMPYDQSELQAERSPRSSAATPAPQSSAKRTVTATAPQTSERPTPSTAAAPAAPRVPRSSPSTNGRRNELAEALTGLSPERQTARPEQPPIDADSVPMPEVAQSEELPSYLADQPAAPAPRQQAARAPAARPQSPARTNDIRDALLSKAQPSPVPAAAAPATADDAAGLLGAVPNPTPAAEAPAPANPVRAIPTKPAAAAVAADAPQASPSHPAAAAGRPKQGLLFTSKHPVIASNIEGPQQIIVGRQAEYKVTLMNSGNVAANELTAVIAAPAEAEVVDAVASNGEVQRIAAEGGQDGEITWRLYELAPGASQTLTLQLVPRSGRQLQLGVEWSHAPVGGLAVVQVQEPKLQMEIAGPSDVLYGKSQRYALTLTNPGNGPAENVSIELTPPGGGPDSLVRHTIGLLGAGQSKKIELELTAREAGELPIKAVAVATGDLRAETVKNVMCRKAELQVDWRGPDKKYAGSVATYYFRVRNPGTAAAEQVSVEVALPAGAEVIETSDGHSWDAKRRTVSWNAASLNAGEERFMELQCRMDQPGVNNMEIVAKSAAGDLRDAKSASITVEALADLKLVVTDPQGVVPVGELAEYEIRIQNRGMTAARGVNVVAMFSAGLDPSHVEGGQHTINDGRVAFRTIDNLPAGGETVLRIHAKASQSGTHIFRAEVACEELEVKLAAEETTRFFTEEDRWADASTAYADDGQTTTR